MILSTSTGWYDYTRALEVEAGFDCIWDFQALFPVYSGEWNKVVQSGRLIVFVHRSRMCMDHIQFRVLVVELSRLGFDDIVQGLGDIGGVIDLFDRWVARVEC